MFIKHNKIIYLLLLAILTLSACSKSINVEDIYSTVNALYYQDNAKYKVVNIAKSQIGKPYRSGGSNPKVGFDCSGLIYWAYAQTGVYVPRVTKEQARAGKSVPIVAMKPGDILVFKSKSAPNGLHTAIYEGNNKMIHSPNAKAKVRSENISQVWLKNFKDVRRIL